MKQFFILCFLIYAPLAQLVEHLTLNQGVQGSSPWRRTQSTDFVTLSSWGRCFFCTLIHFPLHRAVTVEFAALPGEPRLRLISSAWGCPTIEFAAHPVGRIAAYFLYTGLRIKCVCQATLAGGISMPGGHPLYRLSTIHFKNSFLQILTYPVLSLLPAAPDSLILSRCLLLRYISSLEFPFQIPSSLMS